jgi:hypothetical protein
MAAPVEKNVKRDLTDLKKFTFWAGKEEEQALRDSKATENLGQAISS